LASPAPDRHAVENILKIDVEHAKQELEAAMAEFWRISAAPPAGGKPKDIAKAIARENGARENLVLALHRLNEFMGEGKLSETL
jgi:hypothetical protein